MGKNVHVYVNSFVPGVLLKTVHAPEKEVPASACCLDSCTPVPSQQGEGLSQLCADQSDSEAEEEIVAKALSSNPEPATQPQQSQQ